MHRAQDYWNGDSNSFLCGLCFSKYAAFFGVYDGHGGKRASLFLQDQLHENIRKFFPTGMKEIAVKLSSWIPSFFIFNVCLSYDIRSWSLADNVRWFQ